MRQQCDADAEFLELRHGFVDAARQAVLLQVQRQPEPDNAAADDRDLHCWLLSFPATIVSIKDLRHPGEYHQIVIPAKAGIHPSAALNADEWVPAFAGT